MFNLFNTFKEKRLIHMEERNKRTARKDRYEVDPSGEYQEMPGESALTPDMIELLDRRQAGDNEAIMLTPQEMAPVFVNAAQIAEKDIRDGLAGTSVPQEEINALVGQMLVAIETIRAEYVLAMTRTSALESTRSKDEVWDERAAITEETLNTLADLTGTEYIHSTPTAGSVAKVDPSRQGSLESASGAAALRAEVQEFSQEATGNLSQTAAALHVENFVRQHPANKGSEVIKEPGITALVEQCNSDRYFGDPDFKQAPDVVQKAFVDYIKLELGLNMYIHDSSTDYYDEPMDAASVAWQFTDTTNPDAASYTPKKSENKKIVSQVESTGARKVTSTPSKIPMMGPTKSVQENPIFAFDVWHDHMKFIQEHSIPAPVAKAQVMAAEAANSNFLGQAAVVETQLDTLGAKYGVVTADLTPTHVALQAMNDLLQDWADPSKKIYYTDYADIKKAIEAVPGLEETQRNLERNKAKQIVAARAADFDKLEDPASPVVVQRDKLIAGLDALGTPIPSEKMSEIVAAVIQIPTLFATLDAFLGKKREEMRVAGQDKLTGELKPRLDALKLEMEEADYLALEAKYKDLVTALDPAVTDFDAVKKAVDVDIPALETEIAAIETAQQAARDETCKAKAAELEALEDKLKTLEDEAAKESLAERILAQAAVLNAGGLLTTVEVDAEIEIADQITTDLDDALAAQAAAAAAAAEADADEAPDGSEDAGAGDVDLGPELPGGRPTGVEGGGALDTEPGGGTETSEVSPYEGKEVTFPPPNSDKEVIADGLDDALDMLAKEVGKSGGDDRLVAAGMGVLNAPGGENHVDITGGKGSFDKYPGKNLFERLHDASQDGCEISFKGSLIEAAEARKPLVTDDVSRFEAQKDTFLAEPVEPAEEASEGGGGGTEVAPEGSTEEAAEVAHTCPTAQEIAEAIMSKGISSIKDVVQAILGSELVKKYGPELIRLGKFFATGGYESIPVGDSESFLGGLITVTRESKKEFEITLAGGEVANLADVSINMVITKDRFMIDVQFGAEADVAVVHRELEKPKGPRLELIGEDDLTTRKAIKLRAMRNKTKLRKRELEHMMGFNYKNAQEFVASLAPAENLRPAQRAKAKRKAIAEHFGKAIGAAGAPEANRYIKSINFLTEAVEALPSNVRFHGDLDDLSISNVVDLLIQAEWAAEFDYPAGVHRSGKVLIELPGGGYKEESGSDYQFSYTQ